MKNKNLLLSLFAVSALAAGCEQSEKAATENQAATAKQLDKVETETKEAAQSMKDYTYAQKTAFVEATQTQLAAINRDLEQLAAKIEKCSDAAKAEATPKLQAVREQADKLNQQLDKAKNATESTWDDVKAGTRKAYGELKDDFQQARRWVSDKIDP